MIACFRRSISYRYILLLIELQAINLLVFCVYSFVLDKPKLYINLWLRKFIVLIILKSHIIQVRVLLFVTGAIKLVLTGPGLFSLILKRRCTSEFQEQSKEWGLFFRKAALNF